MAIINMESFKYSRSVDLTPAQHEAYTRATDGAYPEFLLASEVIKNCWDKLESNFPNYQLALLNTDDELLGFINSIPLFWDAPLSDLPPEGWDWLMQKGIDDFENSVPPNCLGGIQINILPAHRGKGLSKILIAKGKELQQEKGLAKFIIPIRPSLKANYPAMTMAEYINLKSENKIYDPWIRTHVRNGATLIKVCENAMNVKGDIAFWEKMLLRKFSSSGFYFAEGGLNGIAIDLEKDKGEYREENIWIEY